jgi:hypothetical protein
MRFPLTDEVLREAERYQLRSACRHCFFWSQKAGRCAHEWPDSGQSRWPLTAPHPSDEPDGVREIAYCKEFELR